MKNFTKILFLGICTLTVQYHAYSQCVPDNSTPDWSIIPYQLPQAVVNTPYSQVLNFKAGTDTTTTYLSQTVSVKIDSMKVTGVSGLPAGFTYVCHNTSCNVLGGQAGCVTLSGMPSVRGHFPLTVYVTIWGKAQLFVQIPVSSSDSVTRYALDIDWATGIADIREETEMKIFPNPAAASLNIVTPGHASGKKIIVITDLQGKEMYRNEHAANDAHIDLQGFGVGMYFVSVDNGHTRQVKKFSIQ